MKTKSLTLLLSSVLLLSWSCTKETSYSDLPTSSNWILPLLNGEFSPVSLTALNNKAFDFTVFADDIGLNSGAPISSPVPITVNDAGSFPIETTDLVETLTLDSGQLSFNITNYFPVTVKAGTIISLVTAGSATPVIQLTLPDDLSPGTSQSYNFDLGQKHLNHELFLSVDKLIVDSFNDVQFRGSEIRMSIQFLNLSVSELGIAAQKNYEIRDTIAFNSSMIEYDDYDKMLTDSTINATINFTALNYLPVNVTFQIYFYDMYSGALIDSLFIPNISVDAADNAGTPIEAKQKEKIYKSRIDRIKNAEQVIYSLNLDTYHQHGGTQTITKEQTLKLKASGDIRILFSPSFLSF